MICGLDLVHTVPSSCSSGSLGGLCAGLVWEEDSGDPCCWLGAVPVALELPQGLCVLPW